MVYLPIFTLLKNCMLWQKKRTVYSLKAIKSNFSSSSKLILFKYYKTLENPISYNKLIKNHILINAPISIVKVDSSKVEKLVNDKIRN